MGNEKTLGSILVERGALTAEALAGALAQQENGDQRLGEILVEQGVLGEEAIRWALAEQMDLPLIHPDPEALDPDALALLPAELCRRYGVLPLYLVPETAEAGETLILAAADPASQDILTEVAARVGRPLRVVAALREEIEAALDRVYGAVAGTDVGIHSAHLAEEEAAEVMEDPSGTSLLHHLLERVLADGGGGMHLRLRDGEAQVEDLRGNSRFAGGETWHTILLDRLRHLADIPAGDGAVLQRGGFLFPRPVVDHPALFRVSILRGVVGEEAQVKLIEWEGEGKSLSALGLGGQQSLAVRQALAKPGLVWLTAPGEAGMGSTLFGLLREIPTAGKTLTMEEEVFYRSPGFLQIEALE
jgi:type IV pilus assembly protein PilB